MSNDPVIDAWIVTRSGIQFDLLRPTAEMVSPVDIVTTLSRICRFGGHTERFYSVAEHSIHCSELVPESDRLAALLHDAAEAYIGDITSPLKAQIPYVKVLERRIQSVIAERFGLKEIMTTAVKTADEWMLHREALELMPWGRWASLEIAGNVDHITIACLTPEESAVRFSRRLADLLGIDS